VRQSREVRDDWMFQLASVSQRAACAMNAREHRRRACWQFLRYAPTPETRFEELVLYGMLFEAALGGFGASAAQRLARTRKALRVLLPPEPTAEERDRALAGRAARIIIGRCSEPLNTRTTAIALDSREATLRRAFRETWGLSMRAFQIRARVREAIRLFEEGTTDVLAVSRLVGYHSEKNFYRAVRAVLGVTPGQLARTPREHLARYRQITLPAAPITSSSRSDTTRIVRRRR
jgi:AraC-like DNA-binding protein